MNCKDCYQDCQRIGCDIQVQCTGYIAKPQTNADHIRAMTDEELAEWLFHYSMVCVPGKLPNQEDCVDGCKHCWFDWLKEVYKE